MTTRRSRRSSRCLFAAHAREILPVDTLQYRGPDTIEPAAAAAMPAPLISTFRFPRELQLTSASAGNAIDRALKYFLGWFTPAPAGNTRQVSISILIWLIHLRALGKTLLDHRENDNHRRLTPAPAENALGSTTCFLFAIYVQAIYQLSRRCNSKSTPQRPRVS
jgi:hypothetical protein